MSISYVIDTSAWVEYFAGSPKGIKISKLIEEGRIATSIIAIAELAYVFERKEISFEKQLNFIQSRATFVPITVETALQAAHFKKQLRQKKEKFSLADGIHLATAVQQNATLITTDTDFSGLPSVLLL